MLYYVIIVNCTQIYKQSKKDRSRRQCGASYADAWAEISVSLWTIHRAFLKGKDSKFKVEWMSNIGGHNNDRASRRMPQAVVGGCAPAAQVWKLKSYFPKDSQSVNQIPIMFIIIIFSMLTILTLLYNIILYFLTLRLTDRTVCPFISSEIILISKS